jgi:hypothetical protein
MRKRIIIFSLALSALTLMAQPGFNWEQTAGHAFYGETKSVLGCNAAGDVLMAGGFIDTAGFGATNLISAGFTDLFLAKYGAGGDLKWVFREGGTNYDYISDLAVHEDGIYLGGTFYGVTAIGTETFESLGSQDFFISAYDSEGDFRWAQHFGSPKTDYLGAIDSDGEGNLFFTGYFYDSLTVAGTTLYAAGASDIFLAKLDPAGSLLWIRQGAGPSSDQSYTLSCDNDGNVLLTASYFYSIQLGDTLLTTENPTGVFFAKFDGSGNLLFARQADGNGLIARSLAEFDSEGNIYFGGNFSDQLSLGPYLFDAGAFNVDVFIAKYSPDGSLLWAGHGQGGGSDQLVSLSAGPLNDVYLTGHYLEDIHFDDLTLSYTLCCGSAEIFIVRYTEDGIPVWGEQISGERAMVESVAKNMYDDLFVSGMFQYDLALGNNMLTAENDYENFIAGLLTGTYTGIIDQGNRGSARLYPVPAIDHVVIDAGPGFAIWHYEITDILGKRHAQGQFTGSTRIGLQALQPGIYFVRLNSSKGDIQNSLSLIKK